MDIKVDIQQVYYTDEQKKLDEDEIENNLYAITEINKLIDMILDKHLSRDNNRNATYTCFINNKILVFSFTTNIFGEQPRYEIE
jgi:hypothetical protein